MIGMKYFHLEWEKLRTLVMLNLIFNSQFRVLIVRERRHFWASVPGKVLLIFSLATIIIFFLLGVYGIFIPVPDVNKFLLFWGSRLYSRLGLIFLSIIYSES